MGYRVQVLIVENQRLLGAGLQSLLSNNTDLHVVGISPHNQIELVQEIRKIQPDAVILDKDSHLTDVPDLLAYLEDYPRLCVIVISTNDYLARIYSKRDILFRQAIDLVEFIQERGFNDQTP